ncbi:MAG: ABC transporter permease subunit [Actinomycetes bacterium]
MLGSYTSELVRTARRPAVWVLLATWMVLYHLFSYVLPYVAYLTGDENAGTDGVPPLEALRSTLPDQLVANSLSGTPVFAGALALIFGALVVGGDYGWGTLKTLLTQGPSRLSVLGGKLLVLVTGAGVTMLVTYGTGALVSMLIASREGRALAWPTALDLGQGFAAGWTIFTMWCLAGAFLAFVFRSVALPIGLGVVWILAVENLVSAMADSVLTALQPLRDVMPGVNAGSLVNALTSDIARGEAAPGVTDAVSGGQALLTLTLYLLVFAVGSILVLRRRDVA